MPNLFACAPRLSRHFAHGTTTHAICLAAALIALLLSTELRADSATRPNIVFIMADDK